MGVPSFCQRLRTGGLNLVVAAIVFWNTVYLEQAATLRAEVSGQYGMATSLLAAGRRSTLYGPPLALLAPRHAPRLGRSGNAALARLRSVAPCRVSLAGVAQPAGRGSARGADRAVGHRPCVPGARTRASAHAGPFQSTWCGAGALVETESSRTLARRAYESVGFRPLHRSLRKGPLVLQSQRRLT
jgi:hypothetical protein